MVAAVDQYVARLRSEGRHGAAHGLEARLVDVERIDLGDGRQADANGDRHPPNLRLDPFAHVSAERLGIVEILDQRLARQNDGRGHHRTGKRSHADLIDASDRCDSHLLEQSLVRA